MRKITFTFLLVFGFLLNMFAADTLLITRETFGTQERGSNNPIHQPTGFGAGYNWNDCSFTNNNGEITSGSDSSVRLINYMGATPVFPAAWPNPSGNMHLFLANQGSYAGSWDTLVFSNINSGAYIVTDLAFGYTKRSGYNSRPNGGGLSVEISVNGGAYTEVDTSVIVKPIVADSWQYVKIALGAIKANTISLRVSALYDHIYLDDISLYGMMDTINVALETFGTIQYGTGGGDNGKPISTGDTLAGGWKNGSNVTWRWDDITTFTSTNGHIEAGRDSSIRVINYGSGFTVPAGYPNQTVAINLLLTNRSAYAGSWDTAVYSDINIEGVTVNSVNFGFAKNGNLFINADTAMINVDYRVDNGAWVQLDTSLIPSFASGAWVYLKLPVANVTGNTMDVRFAGLITSQALMDDIAVRGVISPVDSLKITGPSKVIESKDGTLQLSAATYPVGSYSFVTWSVNNGLATIDQNGLVTAQANGVVVAKVVGIDGKTARYTITISNQNPKPFPIENVVVGSVTDSADFEASVTMSWDADSIYMTFAVADDSIVNAYTAGNAYQVDNIEVYFDMDNSKNVIWPRNDSWNATVDPNFDANDFQLRLVPDSAFSLNNNARPTGASIASGYNQAYSVTDTGYKFVLSINWDVLLPGYVPATGDTLGYDVLISDNDAVASSANRNQITLNSSTDKAFNDPSLWGTVKLLDGGFLALLPDNQNPGFVKNLAVAVDTTSALFTWDNATDNTGIMYYVLRVGSDTIDTVLAKQTGNSLLLTGLPLGFTALRINTIDNNGNVSGMCPPVSANIVPIVVPFVISTNDVDFVVYPNPVSGLLTISNASLVKDVKVVDITGRDVYSTSNNVNNEITIDFTSLKNGMYILQINTVDGAVINERIIKE
jgi:hypothetical protein